MNFTIIYEQVYGKEGQAIMNEYSDIMSDIERRRAQARAFGTIFCYDIPHLIRSVFLFMSIVANFFTDIRDEVVWNNLLL